MAVIRLRDPLKTASWEVVSANKEAAQLLGPSVQSFLRSTLTPKLPKPQNDNLPGLFAEAMRTPRSIYLGGIGKAETQRQNCKLRIFGIKDNCAGLLFEDAGGAGAGPTGISPELGPEIARMIVWRADPRTLQVTHVSQQAQEILGYWPERWQNEVGFLKNHLHPEDREKVIRMANEVAHFDVPRECECRMLAADGQVKHFYLTMGLYPELKPSFPQRLELGGVMSDITHIREMEAANHELSRQLIRLQDNEQRRISRELHDGLGQLLVAIVMQLDAAIEDKAEAGPKNAILECKKLANEAVQELRTMSYLLHPPMLGELGLPGAVRIYVQGYMERSGIAVRLHMTPNPERLPEDIELALMRIIQECLTNIHRHTESRKADVWIEWQKRAVELRVRDYGKGIPETVLIGWRQGRSGVGLAAMRERVRDLNGEIAIKSSPKGTTILVRVPLAAEMKRADGSTDGPRAAKASA